MLRIFLLACLSTSLLADNYFLKEYNIPNTKAKIMIPQNLKECIKSKITISLCSPAHNNDLIITMFKNKSAKAVYLNDYYNQKDNLVKIYGAGKVNDMYWFDFSLSENFGGNQNRIFAVYKQLNAKDSIKLHYALLGTRITGYTLLRYQKSLNSLTVE